MHKTTDEEGYLLFDGLHSVVYLADGRSLEIDDNETCWYLCTKPGYVDEVLSTEQAKKLIEEIGLWQSGIQG